MDVTTVKLHKSTKSALDDIRTSGETYDDVINRLISQKRIKQLQKDLIDGYKNASRKDIIILDEWDSSSREVW